ncbi:hypothetical protein SAMN05661012_05234 [Chitinophaga sancti]|uniref:Uncharacterized protein n=1 Tax=Chitinophaga sancti TaxID=1004 RepID=A0A1K1SDR5_9BACT|nr:hypothetical protein SAMN05661012_05234 [Chitinophaga sancti]
MLKPFCFSKAVCFFESFPASMAFSLVKILTAIRDKVNISVTLA